MKILLDHCVPLPLRANLSMHTVETASFRGWEEKQNGDLLSAAEAAGFDCLITVDKKIRYQQNLSARKIAVVLLSKQRWRLIQPAMPLVVAALSRVRPNAFIEVQIPDLSSRSRGAV